MSDDKELYEKLGALIQGDKDIKDELKFIHKTIVDDRKDFKDLETRVRNVEKRQYTIVILATAVWAGIVLLVKKFI